MKIKNYTVQFTDSSNLQVKFELQVTLIQHGTFIGRILSNMFKELSKTLYNLKLGKFPYNSSINGVKLLNAKDILFNIFHSCTYSSNFSLEFSSILKYTLKL